MCSLCSAAACVLCWLQRTVGAFYFGGGVVIDKVYIRRKIEKKATATFYREDPKHNLAIAQS